MGAVEPGGQVTAPAAASTPAPPRRAAKGAAPDEAALAVSFERLKKRVMFQTWAIGGLGLALILILPLAQPSYVYYAMNPENKGVPMVGLDMPNMTNRAVLAWATTSITEIMTMGFGDMDVKLPQQKIRFTDEGWESYTKTFVRQKIGETFKKSQLVLTTVPSNTPVIVAQGVNLDQTYQWTVQMPIIMTYATNNNVTERKSGVVTLEIVRVPTEADSSGIAIKNWYLN